MKNTIFIASAMEYRCPAARDGAKWNRVKFRKQLMIAATAHSTKFGP